MVQPTADLNWQQLERFVSDGDCFLMKSCRFAGVKVLTSREEDAGHEVLGVGAGEGAGEGT